MTQDQLHERLRSLSPKERAALSQRLNLKTGGSTPAAREGVHEKAATSVGLKRKMDFSLLYFSGGGTTAQADLYKTFLETVKFADSAGFKAIWIPERHFQEFGALYPNPAVLAAAAAMITRQIQIRAGSVVLPLHHPVRVMEEWSMVDNLSGGRVGISVATGWHPGDYLIAPQNYSRRREISIENLGLIRRLWAGKEVLMPDVDGKAAAATPFPRPIQRELPVWLTVSSNPQTWVAAGAEGLNVLCALISHSLDQLPERIASYRKARADHGHDPDSGIVSLMLHTFTGEDTEECRRIVREPMLRYLEAFIEQNNRLAPEESKKLLRPQDRQALLEHTFRRYFEGNSLMGNREKCLALLDRLHGIGVNEAACLVEFGLPLDTILSGLEHLKTIRERYNEPVASL